MKKIQDKPGGRPAKKRTEKQKKVVSTKLTELQYYASGSEPGKPGCASVNMSGKQLFRQRSYPG